MLRSLRAEKFYQKKFFLKTPTSHMATFSTIFITPRSNYRTTEPFLISFLILKNSPQNLPVCFGYFIFIIRRVSIFSIFFVFLISIFWSFCSLYLFITCRVRSLFCFWKLINRKILIFKKFWFGNSGFLKILV